VTPRTWTFRRRLGCYGFEILSNQRRKKFNRFCCNSDVPCSGRHNGFCIFEPLLSATRLLRNPSAAPELLRHFSGNIMHFSRSYNQSAYFEAYPLHRPSRKRNLRGPMSACSRNDVGCEEAKQEDTKTLGLRSFFATQTLFHGPTAQKLKPSRDTPRSRRDVGVLQDFPRPFSADVRTLVRCMQSSYTHPLKVLSPAQSILHCRTLRTIHAWMVQSFRPLEPFASLTHRL
jgi:hypothetical protein